ncbi:MAG: outer membrane protein assembly factor BamB family protein [Candidatus Limnocylindrales bacterium]
MIVTPHAPSARIADGSNRPEEARAGAVRRRRLRLAGSLAATLLAVAACGSPAAGTPSAGAGGSATSGSPSTVIGGLIGGGAGPSGAASGPVATPIPLGVTSVAAPFASSLLIADRGNGRLLVISNSGRILWKFPVAGSLPKGQAFAADDAFISPDGKTIVTNDEDHQVINRIDIATRKVIWQYGTYNRAGSGKGQLHTPDDAYPLANGDIMAADIGNCRILQIAPDKTIRRMWGRTGVCVANAPYTYGAPNGATPLPDGGVLITQIRGARVTRLNAAGKVIFDIHVPLFYPSDAQLDAHGNVVVADYHSPGAVIGISPTGKLLWRYAPTSGPGRLDHPSLATPLPNGLVSINDDDRQRIVVIDPRTLRIVWQYGHTDRTGTAPGYLSDPDGHQPMPPGLF